MRSFVVALLLTLFTLPAAAGEKAVKLSVPGMFCASCPYVVRAAIGQVEGVKTVTADVETRTASVVFDDTVTSLDVILSATANAGYPSTLVPAGS